MTDPGGQPPYRSLVQPWSQQAPQPLLQTRVFSVRRHLGISPGGDKRAPFVVIDCADWVNVIARTPAGEIVLVEQYRHGTDSVTVEIPGGIVDPGEDYVAAALRELAEETGYRPADPESAVRIGLVQPNPAIQSNRCATVLVDGVLPGPAAPDEHEELAVRLAPLDEVHRLIRQGIIGHALVVAAFHHLHLRGG